MPDHRPAASSVSFPVFALLLVAVLGLAGCASRPAIVETTIPAAGTAEEPAAARATSPPAEPGAENGSGQEKEPLAAEGFAEAPLAGEDLAAEEDRLAGLDENSLRRILQPIYFAFDSSALGETALRTLERNAAWLRQHPDWRVRVEGHCDERGTSEYNLALGARRARRVKEQLVRLGIAPERIETISYGEERPVDPGHDEAAWSKNRRAEFLPLRPEGR